MGTHPSMDELLRAAAGEPDARRNIALHLQTCSTCREQFASLLGVLDGAGAELIESRPGCPPPEELAVIPVGGEQDNPHVHHCPMCREELAMIRELEARRNLESAFRAGRIVRPELTTTAAGAWLQGAPGERAELDLVEGAEAKFSVAEATIRLRVEREELDVRVEGADASRLELVLENDLFERRILLAEGRQRFGVRGWSRAKVKVRKEAP